MLSERWIATAKLLSAAVSCGLAAETPGLRDGERSSRKKQELASVLCYSRKQRGVTTETRMMTDRLDFQFNRSLLSKKKSPERDPKNTFQAE